MDIKYLIREGTFQIGRDSTTTLTEQVFSLHRQGKITIKWCFCGLCQKAILIHKISFKCLTYKWICWRNDCSSDKIMAELDKISSLSNADKRSSGTVEVVGTAGVRLLCKDGQPQLYSSSSSSWLCHLRQTTSV